MKKRILIVAICMWAMISATVFAANITPKIKNIVVRNYETQNVDVRVINVDGIIYISIDDILKGTGFQLGWEPYHGAVIVYNPAISRNMYVYLSQNKIWDGYSFINYNNPILIHNQSAYITEQMLKDITWRNYTFELQDMGSEIDYDKYRRSGQVLSYNGINLLDGYYAFETVTINEYMANDYANAVNAIAKTLPQDVNVYNMVIPNSGEYYAPEGYSTNLRDVYQQLYMNLDTRVTPIDVYDVLFEHADEPIFFNTDHHWTQRGAYYAFEQFMRMRGIKLAVNYLNIFKTSHADNLVGSFASIMKGTEGEKALKTNPELLERFIPPYPITKEVYNDCKMEKYVAKGPLINEDLLAYSTFLGGDVPVMKLHNKQYNDGSVLCILKESYANAFAVWAACNYEYVYLVDIRCFNGANGMTEPFDMKTFQEITGFDDLLIMSYPNTIADAVLRDYIRKFSGYSAPVISQEDIWKYLDTSWQDDYWRDEVILPKDDFLYDIPGLLYDDDLRDYMPVYSEELGMWK